MPLPAGTKLGHYCIVAEIGAGGMGVVYRAHDDHLDRDVALKMLPAGTLADEPARRRFRREALALSKLNHPNIATVFDFDTQHGVDFLAMELIAGATLDAKLKEGPLAERESLRLGMQLAEGLAAAHAEGVVHRDLKPGNLIVTPDGRLKILDFGVAMLLHPGGDHDVTRSATETDGVSGTLPYMSPEQLRGESTDARSDIYAAGIVLYEMATGRRAFPQTQGPQLIGAVLHETPARPSSINRQVTPELENVVLKASDKEPSRRYQSAHELLVALEGLSTGGARPTGRERLRWPIAVAGSLALVVVLVAGLLVGLNVGGWRDRLLGRVTSGSHAGGTAGIPIKARRSVAVLGFKNLSGRPDAAWLSTALSEMLTTELAAGEQLRTIPGESVSQMKINLALADADSYGKDTLSKIRANLGTDDVVLGSYVPLGGGQIRLDLRLQDAVVGETLAAISERGSETQIDDLVSRAGSALRQKLGASELSAAEAVAVKATLPSKPDAVRLYTEGLAKLRIFDALTARDLLAKAVAADPAYSLAHAALAAAWSTLGYDEKAKAEAKLAFELSTSLSREERLFVEGRYRETTREREKAVEIYRTLWSFFPDNLDYGLRLAAAQTSAGKGRDALTTIEALRKLPQLASADPRLDLAEAGAASSISDLRRQQAAAERAAARGSAQGARLLVARAQVSEGSAHILLGEMGKATALYESAREIFAAAGDRGGAASVLSSIGTIYWQRGELSKAEETYKQALVIRREIGNKSGVALSLNNLAAVRYSQKDLPATKKYMEDSLAIRREINDRAGVATSLNNIGIVLLEQGEQAASKRMHEESLAIKRAIGDKRGVAMSLTNIAVVLSSEPDLPGAKRMFEEALAIHREIGFKTGAAFTMRAIGVVLSKRGDLPAAHKNLEEALAMQNEMGEKGEAAETRRALAGMLIDEGQAARAETLAREAVDEFQTEKAGVSEASARGVLAQSELVQGNLAEARKAIDDATKLLAKSDDRDVRLSVLTTVARVRAASGETVQAAKDLEAVLAEAVKFHFIDAELEARLALGEIEIRSGQSAAGRARLAALEKEATAKGFGLIARKAAVGRK